MTIELERLLNSESLARLREEAERRHAPIDGLIRDALENYIAALDENERAEASDAALAERFQTGLQELIEGKGIPAEESLARLHAKSRYSNQARYKHVEKTWYIAEILEEIQAANDTSALLYIDWILVNASDAEEAYTKALAFGTERNQEWHNNEGVLITVTFRGLHDLYEIYEELTDGAEIAYSKYEDISREDIERMIKPKEELGVFLPREGRDLE